MPVKTITAEIDGKVRKIKADIPDDASPEEIHDAVSQFLGHESEPKQPEGSAIERFAQAYNPMPLVHRLFQSSGNHALDMSGYTLGRNIVGLVGDLGMAQVEEGKKAIQSFQDGNHTDAIAHGLAALTPVFGPMSQQAADKFIEGDFAGGAGIMSSMVAPELVPKAIKAARALPETVANAGDTIRAAGTKAADIVTSPEVTKGLKRGAEGTIIGSALHGNIPGVAAGTAARIGAEYLEDVGNARRVAKTPPAPAPATVTPSAPAPTAAAPVASPAAPVPTPIGNIPTSVGAPAPWDVEVRGPAPAASPIVSSPPGPAPSPEPAIPPATTPEAPSPAIVTPAAPVEPVSAEPVKAGEEVPAKPDAKAAAEALGDLGTKDLKLKESVPGADAYEAEGRNDKADAVAQKLFEHGIPSSDLADVDPHDPMWEKLFKDLGQHEPGKFSGDAKATVEQTILKLKNLEKANRPAPLGISGSGADEAGAAPVSPEPTGVAGNPAAQAAAQALQAELDKAPTSVGGIMKKTRKPK